MSKGLVMFYLTLVLFAFIGADASGIGKCPAYKSMENFDYTRFSGEWYEVERSFYLYEVSYGCTRFNLTINPWKNYDVEGSTKNLWSDEYKTFDGSAILLFPNSSVFRFRRTTKLPYMLSQMLPGTGLYSVLYTDYDNVAIVWSCSSIILGYNDRIWIFGRKNYLTEDLRISTYYRAKQLGLDPDRLIVTKNKNCIL